MIGQHLICYETIFNLIGQYWIWFPWNWLWLVNIIFDLNLFLMWLVNNKCILNLFSMWLVNMECVFLVMGCDWSIMRVFWILMCLLNTEYFLSVYNVIGQYWIYNESIINMIGQYWMWLESFLMWLVKLNVWLVVFWIIFHCDWSIVNVMVQ